MATVDDLATSRRKIGVFGFVFNRTRERKRHRNDWWGAGKATVMT